MAMGDDTHSCMEHAILSNINLCQSNGDTELKEATIAAMIEALLKGSTVMSLPRPRHICRKIKTQNSVVIELSKE
jgi:broad specificity polyphosphatase/5'/3'-nucleotidase SurE